MKTIQQICQAIDELKQQKPPGWKSTIKTLCRTIEKIDSEFKEFEDHGTEERGRHFIRLRKCISFDDFDDESNP